MKKTQFLLVALFVTALASGCGKKETADNSGSAPPAKKFKLAFVSNNAANFWTIARTGCDDAAKELGDVEVDFRIPANGTAAEQQQILNDLLARGEDGIAMSPKDPANQTDFLNKIAGQTLFITTDSDAPASKRVCYIGTDNEAAGEEEAGDTLVGEAALAEEGNFVLQHADGALASDLLVRDGGVVLLFACAGGFAELAGRCGHLGSAVGAI